MHQCVEDIGVIPSVIEGQDIKMGPKRDILEVDVQGEEDVLHAKEAQEIEVGEGAIEEEVLSS